MKRGNLYDDARAPIEGERFDELTRDGGLLIERIVSSGGQPPETYDQDHDEWVVLLRGRAVLEVGVDTSLERLELGPGDWLWLPAHTSHKVIETSSGALWLAVHHSGR